MKNKDTDKIKGNWSERDEIPEGTRAFRRLKIRSSDATLYLDLAAMDFVISLPEDTKRMVDGVFLTVARNNIIVFSDLFVFLVEDINSRWGYKLLLKLLQKNPPNSAEDLMEISEYNNGIIYGLFKETNLNIIIQILLTKDSDIKVEDVIKLGKKNGIPTDRLPVKNTTVDKVVDEYFSPVDEVEL